MTCRTPGCSQAVVPVCDNTAATLPFGDEMYFALHGQGMSATKNRAEAMKRVNAIFGKPRQSVSEELIVYIRTCIRQSLNKVSLSEFTIDDVFACLKTHGWTSLYQKDLVSVFCKVTGRPFPVMRDVEKKRVAESFLKARYVYYRFCKPANRSRFIDYNYLWYKLLELVKAKHLLVYIKLFAEKTLGALDGIFHAICVRLNWHFEPTPAPEKPNVNPLPLVESTGQPFPPNPSTTQTLNRVREELLPPPPKPKSRSHELVTVSQRQMSDALGAY
jgi:hypothetical protein